jgi:hypothetical protein
MPPDAGIDIHYNPVLYTRALRETETETETETERFSINRKPTDGRFLIDRFLVFLILVGLGLQAALY